jgi:hypothetical protein
MTFYYLVDSLNERVKPGIYGRRLPTDAENQSFTFGDILSVFDLSEGLSKGYNMKNPWNLLRGPLFPVVTELVKNSKTLFERYRKTTSVKPLFLTAHLEEKVVIIPKSLLDNDYRIEGSEAVLHGAFIEFDKKAEDAFETILDCQVDSNLVITEKSAINKKHFGGSNGQFQKGLYFEHPKDREILLPVNNSSELLQSLILEEIVQTYEALGAKRIEIIDEVDFTGEQNVSGIVEGVKVGVTASQSQRKKVLRKKEYGRGVFDPTRAMNGKKFIHDLPNIMTTVEGRIHGNQTLDSFTEVIDLSGGLNLNVAALYTADVKLNLKRKWYFEVEFYDKLAP